MAIDLRDTVKRFLDWRQPGGALSVGAHTLLLVASVYAFNSAQPFQPATEALAVDVVSEKDFNEMMKGDKTSKIIAKEPERRVDRVAETKEDKDPGLDKKEVPVAPSKQEAKSEPEPKLAAIVPPTRPPELRVTPPTPTPPVKAEEDDEIDEKAELLRRKKIEDQKKAEDAAKAAAEAKRKLDEKLKADAQAKALEDKKKLDEALKAEAQTKALEDKKRADEKKAREDKAKKEQAAKEAAEEKARNDRIRNVLNQSKEPAASTGATGAAVSTRSTAGATDATGKKLSPSELSGLIAEITTQMNNCIAYSGPGFPKTIPIIHLSLSVDGRIIVAPTLKNKSQESQFMPFAEASMRALRNCQPYRISQKYKDSYQEWKDLELKIRTPEF